MRAPLAFRVFVCLSMVTACSDEPKSAADGGQDATPVADATSAPDTIAADSSPSDSSPSDSSPSDDDTAVDLDTVVAPETSPGAFEIGAVPGSEPEFAPYFEKHVEVFGLNVFGTAGVPDEDLLHASAVLAQYLDNDEDGVPDDLAILDALQSGSGGPASMVMFATEWEIESSGIFESNLGDRALQDLYATETHPGGSSSSTGFDATLEEVLHLVTHHGWAKAYPLDFDENPGSSLTDAMDAARGGQFMSIPASYPPEAWYHYDDQTCTYDCMATEYVYWALTSLLGAQSYPGRCESIEHEWELCTPEAVQTQDTLITALLQESGYTLPSVLPDGTYEPTF